MPKNVEEPELQERARNPLAAEIARLKTRLDEARGLLEEVESEVRSLPYQCKADQHHTCDDIIGRLAAFLERTRKP